MEEDRKLEKKKNIEIVILSIIIVALLGALVYLLFIKKGDKPVDNNGGNNPPVSNNTNEGNQANNNSLQEIELTKTKVASENISVSVKNETVTMKTYDNSLYVNNKNVYTADIFDGSFVGYSVYANKDSEYAIIEVNSQGLCGDDSGYIAGAINSQGEFVEVEQKFGNDYVDLPACSLSIYSKNNKIYGIRSGVDDINEKDFSYNIEFTFK